MAEKGFGVKEVNLIGASGTPTITSPNNINMNAVNVAISTNVSIGGTLSVTGNVSVGGTLTYEDVTNIDSIGVITARSGVDVDDFISVGSNIHLGNAGVVTATTFSGSGASLTSIPAANLTGTLPAISGANLTNLPSDTPTNADIQVAYTVTANGSSAYRFEGNGVVSSADNPDIFLIRGQKYRFINNSGGSHPFQIRETSGGTTYSTGVTNNGASSGNIDFAPTFNSPAQLVYQCTNHGGMVGNIYIRGAVGNENNVGVITATTFSGSGASLTSIPAGQLTGTVADARISTLTASKLSGALPAISGANLTNLPSDTPTNSDIQVAYTVTANGSSAYRFEGNGVVSTSDNPDLYLIRGQKYRFINNSGGSHPFQIRVSNAGSAYSTGVTNNGASSGNIDFAPTYDSPAQLVYQCTNHGGMVGNIYLREAAGNNTNVGVTTFTGTIQVHESSSGSIDAIKVTNSTTGSNLNDGLSIGLQANENVFIHNYENTSMLFGTNDTTRLTILADGSIGINETSPQQQLHVHDDTAYNGILINGNGAPRTAFARNTTTTGEWSIGIDGTNGNDFTINNSNDNSNRKFLIGGASSSNANTITSLVNHRFSANVIISNPGSGIDFSATSDGGTGTPSELLDDYEEGSWTPVLKDAASGGNTYSGGGNWTTWSNYTRIGNTVRLHANIYSLTNSGMTTGNGIFIHGAPFTAVGTQICFCRLQYFNNINNTQFGTHIQINNNSTVLRLQKMADNSGASSVLPINWGHIQTQSYFGFIFTLVYKV